jgi:hypothetical protein
MRQAVLTDLKRRDLKSGLMKVMAVQSRAGMQATIMPCRRPLRVASARALDAARSRMVS